MIFQQRVPELYQGLAKQLSEAPTTPVYGWQGALANFGRPLAAELFGRRADRIQKENTQAETDALGRLLAEANEARARGEDPMQAMNQMIMANRGQPGFGNAGAMVQQQQLARLLSGPAKPVRDAEGYLRDPATGARTFPDVTKTAEPTSLARNLEAAGLTPGTPEYQQEMLEAVRRPATQINLGTQSTIGKLRADDQALEAAGVPPDDPTRQALRRKMAAEGRPSGEQLRAREMIESGTQTLDQVMGSLMPDGPDGEIDQGLVKTMWARVPGTKGRNARSQMDEVASFILRWETGAQANEQEIRNTAQRYMPSPLDSEEGQRDKLMRLQRRFENARQIAEGGTPEAETTPVPRETMGPISSAGVPSPTDFGSMSLEQLNTMDMSTLSNEDLQAASRRWQELAGGR